MTAPHHAADASPASHPVATSEPLLARAARIILIAVAVIAAALVVWQLFDVLMLIFAGLLVAVFLNGCSSRLAGLFRLPYAAALATVVLALLAAVAGAAAYAVPQIAAQIGTLAQELTQAGQNLVEQLRDYEWVQRFLQETPAVGELLRRTPDPIAFINRVSSTTFGWLVTLLVLGFVGLYGAIEPDTYRNGTLRLLPPTRRPAAAKLIAELGDTLWWWLIGRGVSMAIIGSFTALGLWWLGIPLPFLLGGFAALLTFIPNIGAVIAVTPPTLLALEQSPWTALMVVVYYTGLQFVESYIINPLVQRKAVSIPPVVLLAAQLGFAVVGGFLGVAIATPLAAVALVLVRRLHVDRLEEDARVDPPSASTRTDSAGRRDLES